MKIVDGFVPLPRPENSSRAFRIIPYSVLKYGQAFGLNGVTTEYLDLLCFVVIYPEDSAFDQRFRLTRCGLDSG